MTQHTSTSPLRRTITLCARTIAAGPLAGLAVAAFAAPAAADEPEFTPPYSSDSVRITGDGGDFTPPYASVRITGDEVDNRDFSVRITGRDQSVRITGDGVRRLPDNRDFSVRITGDGADNREFSLAPDIFLPPFSVRITGDDVDNRDFSVRITGDDVRRLPDNRDFSVRITGAEPDNRDY